MKADFCQSRKSRNHDMKTLDKISVFEQVVMGLKALRHGRELHNSTRIDFAIADA